MLTTEEYNDKPTGSNDGRTTRMTDEYLIAMLRNNVGVSEAACRAAKAAADRIEQLKAEKNAATAAAYEVGDIIVDVVKGVEGPSLYMQDYRVSGPKPWGGGKKIHTFKVAQKDLRRALSTPDQTAALDRLLSKATETYVAALQQIADQTDGITPEPDNLQMAIGSINAYVRAIVAASKKGGV